MTGLLWRIMTYNLHGGRDAKDRPSLKGILATLKATEADLIGLQEVERRLRDRTDQAAFLAGELGYAFRFTATVDRAPGQSEEGKFGLAVLSRWPIISSRAFPLPYKKEPRGLLICLIHPPGDGPLYFATTHLGLDHNERQAQVEAILRLTKGFPSPMILVGDFNARPEAPELAPLFHRWQEVQRACGRKTPTLPAIGAPIDFIFYPFSWWVGRVAVPPSPASDHRPVVADLGITAPPPVKTG